MRRIPWAVSILFAALGAPSVKADAISNYTINFNSTLITGTLLPTSGSFSYDSTTQEFTSFTVNWDSYTWDLTGGANNPTFFGNPVACLGGATGPTASLDLLTVCNTGAPDDWAGSTSSGNNYFFFDDPNGAFVAGSVYILAFGSAPLGQLSVGTYSVALASPVATPEPSTVLLLGVGLLGLIGIRGWTSVEQDAVSGWVTARLQP